MAGNTKAVINTKVVNLWDFPELTSTASHNRIFTKHYVNLTYTLNPNHLSLLSFLIYQSEVDNTFVYSSATLLKYKQAVKLMQERIKPHCAIQTSLPNTRKHLMWLIANGLILPTNADKKYLINPNICYHKLYVKSQFYIGWCMEYRECAGNITNLTDKYINHVNKNICK